MLITGKNIVRTTMKTTRMEKYLSLERQNFCLLPVIVSSGGSTDDFVPFYKYKAFQPFIHTTFQNAPSNLSLVNDGMTKMLEPSKKHLLELFKSFIKYKNEIQELANGINKRQSQKYSWKHFTEKIISLF